MIVQSAFGGKGGLIKASEPSARLKPVSVFQGKFEESVVPVNIQFAGDIETMVFNRFRTNEEFRGDFFAGFAAGDQIQDATLRWGQTG